MILEELYKIIEDRKKKMPENSYTASLFKEGNDRIMQKVGEEATEVIIAAKNETNKRTISEVADLLFHVLILLVAYNISLNEVFKELNKRKTIAKRSY